MSTQYCDILVWMRRDLRLRDHHALWQAYQQGQRLHFVFIFDVYILSQLSYKKDNRLTFIYESLQEIEEKLQSWGGSLHILYGKPEEEIARLAKQLDVQAVFANKDYAPYPVKRDLKVKSQLKTRGIDFLQFKDCCLQESHEVLKGDKTHYKVFTPYWRLWRKHVMAFAESHLKDYSVDEKLLKKKIVRWNNPHSIIRHDYWERLGFYPSASPLRPGENAAQKQLQSFSKKILNYDHDRDYPAMQGTSNLSVYLRHGCISIREAARFAKRFLDDEQAHPTHHISADRWLSELCWRDFYMMILATHPQVVKQSFKPEYDHIQWRGSEELFQAWCQGETGFPIVDSAMRNLNQNGMMPNRLRMVVASFLCKTLLVDWKKGERYFAAKLLDYDQSANNGGWQWAASTGTDAQPYFRIFNPYTQSEKFDGEGKYIRTYCPELSGLPNKSIHDPSRATTMELHQANIEIGKNYPAPIVDYKSQRELAIAMYKEGLNKV